MVPCPTEACIALHARGIKTKKCSIPCGMCTICCATTTRECLGKTASHAKARINMPILPGVPQAQPKNRAAMAPSLSIGPPIPAPNFSDVGHDLNAVELSIHDQQKCLPAYNYGLRKATREEDRQKNEQEAKRIRVDDSIKKTVKLYFWDKVRPYSTI